MLNSAQDNNVLTKCDKESNIPINFQPTPKRFIAWDKYKKEWVTKFLMPSTSNEKSDDYTCPLTLGLDSKGVKSWLNNDQLIICQSTNLFDKDGEEIFEGSVVKDFDNAIGIVHYDLEDGEYRAKSADGDSFELADSSCDLKVLGHILSNPELVEGE